MGVMHPFLYSVLWKFREERLGRPVEAVPAEHPYARALGAEAFLHKVHRKGFLISSHTRQQLKTKGEEEALQASLG